MSFIFASDNEEGGREVKALRSDGEIEGGKWRPANDGQLHLGGEIRKQAGQI